MRSNILKQNMKPSVWSSYFIDLSPEEMVKAFATKGWYFSELSDEHAGVLLQRGNPEKTGAAFKKFADEHGLSFLQGHLKLKCDIAGEKRAEDVDLLKKWLDLFNAVGVKYAVLHPGGYTVSESGRDPERILERNITSLSELCRYIAGTEMTICLENIVQTAPECDDLLRIINMTGAPNLGICLDTGHLNRCSRKQADFIKKAGAYLKALHLNDNEGVTDQHILPYGRGTIPWDEVLAALKDINYSGLMNLEIPGENNCPPEIRMAKLDYIKEIMNYMSERMSASV